jgi:hypothetical protein
MSLLAGLASDLAAIVLLAYAVYFRRYHRRDLLLAYVALNVGVLAVTVLLAGAQAGIGLGLGLFGILSIIRLRSDQITQEEVGRRRPVPARARGDQAPRATRRRGHRAPQPWATADRDEQVLCRHGPAAPGNPPHPLASHAAALLRRRHPERAEPRPRPRFLLFFAAVIYKNAVVGRRQEDGGVLPVPPDATSWVEAGRTFSGCALGAEVEVCAPPDCAEQLAERQPC